MKLLIASDLHGSAHNCRLLLNALEREGADRLVLLGDLLYHGPRNPLPQEYDPQTVAALLNSVKERLFCVRGNCDADVDQLVLDFPILADHALLSVDGVELLATHGHIHGPDNPPPMRSGSYLLCGHTHLPVRRELSGFTYLNPGSLALPKEGTPRSYLTLDRDTFVWHELETGTEFQPLP